MEIGNRLKEFRKRKNIKMPAIAAATGISKENLYKWEKGTKPSDFKLYSKLVDYLDKMDSSPDHVYEEPRANGSQHHKQTTPSLLTGIFLAHDDDALSLPDNNVAPGSIITIDDKPVLIAWRVEAPFMGAVDGVIPVTDDSMEPGYKNGSLVALKKLRYTRIINAGYNYYIIDKNGKGLLRRVRPAAENNSIILTAENENYPEITRNIDDILAIFSIEGRRRTLFKISGFPER
jgi:transcriptional regulator with XRE-family HTH domain